MQDKDTFYEQLNAVEERVAKVDIVIVVDDLMPRYGSTVLLIFANIRWPIIWAEHLP